MKRAWPGRFGRRRVPPMQQQHMSDCGPACLAMVLRYHGRHVSLDEVRERCGGGRDGASAFDLVEAARSFGLEGRAVRLEVEDLPLLPAGSILHWRMSHFVVLERLRRGGAEIVDPDGGARFARDEEIARSFTGVALVLEPAERFEERGREPSRLWAHARRVAAGSGLLGRTLVTSLLLQAFALALPVATGAIVDRVVPGRDVALLAVLSAGIAAIAVYAFFASYVRSHLLLALRTQLDFQMTAAFLRHMLRLPFPFFQLRHTGDLLMRLDSNAVIRESLTSAAMSGVLDGLLVTGYLALILVTDWRLGLVVVALGVVRVGVFLATRRRYRELMGESLQAQAAASSYQVQMIEGIETLKTSGSEARATDLWTNLFVQVLNVSIRRGRLSALVDALLFALELVSPLAVLAFGASLVLEGRMTLGTMLAMAALAGGFLRPLGSLVATALDLQQLGSYVDRVDEVLEKRPEQEAGRAPAPALRGGVRLAGLSFRYAENAPWAVREVDLDVQAGAKIAIVGPSGSGKSTLARLVAGLYVPTEGTVLFDDRDLSGVDLVSLRRQIGFVPQSPFLFGATIRANIALANAEAALEEIERAADLADLSADVASWPLGFETPLATTGSNLSGGQRQRVALARALVTRPPILVLDEATSHLDTRSERRVYANLATLQCTRVVIAHRLSTIVDADVIVVMDQGRIVERGTHEQLARAGGLYAELTSRGAASGPS